MIHGFVKIEERNLKKNIKNEANIVKLSAPILGQILKNRP